MVFYVSEITKIGPPIHRNVSRETNSTVNKPKTAVNKNSYIKVIVLLLSAKHMAEILSQFLIEV